MSLSFFIDFCVLIIKKTQCYKVYKIEETQPLLNKASHDNSHDGIYSPSITVRRRESLIFDLPLIIRSHHKYTHS